MILEVDFNSEEALYIQLRNQIIVGIATNRLKEGESLPSVRQLAESIGINMHIPCSNRRASSRWTDAAAQ